MAKNYRKTRRNVRSRKTRTRNVRKTRTRRFVGGFQEMQKYASPLVVNQVRY